MAHIREKKSENERERPRKKDRLELKWKDRRESVRSNTHTNIERKKILTKND